MEFPKRLKIYIIPGSAALMLGTFLTLTCQVETAGLPIQSMLINKRSPLASDESFSDEVTGDMDGVRYDEYPVSKKCGYCKQCIIFIIIGPRGKCP